MLKNSPDDARRVLILHNEYQQPGGEDVVVRAEAQLLTKAGYDVRVELLTNKSISGFGQKARTLLQAGGNRAQYEAVTRLVEAHQADVVHVHNFFPLLTPSAHLAAANARAAVVQTIHNYRLVCAGATLERDGKVCELCLTGSKLWSVRHRCYKNSIVGTAAVLNMQSHSISSRIWQKSVHRSIALTNFSLSKLVEGGLDPDRVVVKPNFCRVESTPLPQSARKDVIFVGRLTKEKGPWIAIDAFRRIPDITLNILGDGPDRSLLEASAPQNVKFHGSIPRDRVQEILAASMLIIVPSLWYEGFPMSVVEALSLGTPVIASRIGSLAEIVEDGVNGLTFRTGDVQDLVSKIRRLHEDPSYYENLHKGAFRSYTDKYSPDVNIKMFRRIYRDAIIQSRSAA